MRFQIRERFSKLLFLGVVFLSGFWITAEEGKIYAGCPTGSYCAGTTVLDLKVKCNVFENYCTQRYVYHSTISCDSNCAYSSSAYVCDLNKCPPDTWTFVKNYHQGSCCVYPTCTGCSCTPTCGGDYPLGSCTGPGCSSGDRCCTNVNSCGVACGGTTCKTCYVCTTPAAPATPTSVSLRVNTTDYNLSTNSASPTIIDYRNGGTIKVFSNSTTTNYKYDVYNAYSGGTLLLDYSGTTQIQPASGSLAYSHIGRFEARHYNFKCPDNSRNYSGTRIGYYCMERNVKPPATPTGMNMTIDGEVYALSTSAVEPKVVKYPTTNATKTNTKLRVLPARSTPSTASVSGYRVEANNYGLGEWMDFSCARGEDFCNEGTSNEYNFSPNTEALLDVLREGAEGKVDGKYYDVNECDTTKVYSDSEEFYYRVNNNPNPDSGYNCPNILNNEVDRTSMKGCVSTTHTGMEVNNPLKFEIIGSDLDGVDEIQGAIVWLSKNGTTGSIPDFPFISGTYGGSDPNQIAVMVMQRDGSWNNSPYIYTADSTNSYNWANITSNGEIRTTAGVMARVTEASGTPNGNNVVFNIQIEFTVPELGQLPNTYPEGNYEISGLVFDKHMLLAGGTVVDQFYMSTDCRAGGWNIDLRRPIFESGSPTSETVFSRVLKLLWNFNGTGSYATDVVINGYSYSSTKEIILESPGGYPNITLSTPPSEGEIGVIDDVNAWNIINSDASETYDSSARINIGTNDEGTIILYATGFDQACNYVISDDPVTININPWLTSKGGFVYSGGDVGAHAKDYTAYSTFINSVLRKVTAEELDIGTEVVTSRSDTINNFIHPELSAVRASSIYNSNSQMSSWYEYLSARLDEQMVALGQNNFRLFGFPGEITSNRISDYCVKPFLPQAEREYCYMNIQGDLNVVPEYKVFPDGERRKELICDKKTLIMASGDIHIEPDIINGGDDNINGCIFVAGGSITVGAGDWVTQNATILEDTKYDYLDAYLLAEDIIDIQLVDVYDSLGNIITKRDGLEIYGGLVAFGQNIPTGTSAVQANRSFGLWNAYIPTTAITWDPRYAKLAEAFFGPTAAMYKREVGFKPY